MSGSGPWNALPVLCSSSEVTGLVGGGSLAFVGDAEDGFAGPGDVAESGHSRSLHHSLLVTVAMHRE